MQFGGFALRARGCVTAEMAAEAALFAWIHVGALASILLWMMVWYGCSLAARLECEQSAHWSSSVDLKRDAGVVVFAPLQTFRPRTGVLATIFIKVAMARLLSYGLPGM